MSLTDPRFTDGLAAILDPLVQCLNLAGDGTTYQRYTYLNDSITTEGSDEEHADGELHPLGGSSSAGFEKGGLSIRATKATHKLPKPGHVLECDFGAGLEYYRVNAQGRARANRQMVAGSFNVTRLYNPFPLECLSEAYGQRAIKTQAAGALAGSFTSALTAKNVRTGGTVAWSLVAKPNYTVPAWLSINSSTGALSGTAVAGTWELMIVATETLTNEETRAGFGVLSLVIT
jgi:hypothetical protein